MALKPQTYGSEECPKGMWMVLCNTVVLNNTYSNLDSVNLAVKYQVRETLPAQRHYTDFKLFSSP